MPTQPAKPIRGSADPNRPAYDNPARNKGDLAVGNNVREERPRPPDSPEGHDSDKKLGQDPHTDTMPRHR